MFTVTALILTKIATQGVRQDPIMGRWDLQLQTKHGRMVGWLEVRSSGLNTLVGRFMCGFGSARPVSEVISDATGVHFSIPTQWEASSGTIRFDGHLVGKRLEGTISGPVFQDTVVIGVPAPALAVTGPIHWGKPIRLIGQTLDADWWPSPGWKIQQGVLINEEPRKDIVSKAKFTDFKLHAEFRYPAGSNSGIYLRGRYEVQIDDAYGLPADDEHIGGVYGLIPPLVNASKPANQWQSVDITLVGRTVSVTLNGVRIIENQEIAGPTGGALDGNEAEPGPLKLQGDHGRVDFRNVVLTPRQN